MNLNTDRFIELAKLLKQDVVLGYCEASVSIGKVDGVLFRLIAVSEEEAEECDYSPPMNDNNILAEGGCDEPRN